MTIDYYTVTYGIAIKAKKLYKLVHGKKPNVNSDEWINFTMGRDEIDPFFQHQRIPHDEVCDEIPNVVLGIPVMLFHIGLYGGEKPPVDIYRTAEHARELYMAKIGALFGGVFVHNKPMFFTIPNDCHCCC